MDCIRCSVDMKKEAKRGVLIDLCPQCHGIWLDAGELEKMRAGADADHSKLMEQARVELKEEAERPFHIVGMCPKCQVRRLAEIDRFGTKLDYCSKCGGLYFDESELDQVLSFLGARA